MTGTDLVRCCYNLAPKWCNNAAAGHDFLANQTLDITGGYSYRMKRVFCGLLALGVALTQFTLSAGELPVLAISEDEALHLFYERNLALLAAHYNIETAQAQEIIAAAIPNPQVGVQVMGITNTPGWNSSALGCDQTPQFQSGRPHPCGLGQTYSFSQLIEVAGKRGLRMESSALGSQAAESDFLDAVRILTNMVRDAYYALALAQKTRWLAQENVNHYKEIIAAIHLRLRAGDIAESDVLRIEVESFKAQSDLDNADAAVKKAQADLAVILRWPDNSMQFVAQDKWPEMKDIGQNSSEEALIEKALPVRPDLQGDKQRADQAEVDLTLARRLKYPNVTLSGGQTHDPGNTNLNSYFVGLSAEVPVFNQYKGESDKAAVNFNKMRLVAEQTELEVRSDVVSALAAWKSTDTVVRRFEGDVLNRVRKVREAAELAYAKGATSVLDLVEAQRNYKSIMLDYYSAVINRINAYYDLSKAMGVEPNASASFYSRQTSSRTH